MSPAIKVRPGDLEVDRGAVIGLLSRNVNPAYDGRRFDWLYRDNPAGSGRLWMAVDGSTGDLIGTAGAFPRRICVDGNDVIGWVLADFCISDTHRSLGPALQLQRACLEELAADGAALWYDFPSRTMEAVYRRLGLLPAARMRRLVRPLRTYRKLVDRLGSPVVARALSLVADLVLAWGARAPRRRGRFAVGLHKGRCGEEFTTLARRVSPQYGVCAWRSADYLNWRYCDNPIQPHEILTLRLEGSLVAYAVATRDGDAANLVDLFGDPDSRTVSTLVRSVVAVLRQRGPARLDLWLPDFHPWVPLLGRLGFRPRDTAPVVLDAPGIWRAARRVSEGSRWFLTYGDRDS